VSTQLPQVNEVDILKHTTLIQKLIILTSIWAFLVIALGAYTRLTNAGLGCPDWPGCYGHLSVPTSQTVVQAIDASHPTAPLIAHKAWSEMIHRYFAGALGLLILAVVITGWRHINRLNFSKKQRWPFIALFLLLLYQPILGMWTVTWKLMPIIVSQHLLGGMSIFGVLVLSYLVVQHPAPNAAPLPVAKWAVLGVIILFCQMALGAWTSTNYAAIVCSDFPFCQLAPWHYDFHQAFTVFTHIGTNYDGGLISDNAKRTIQMVHRIGALIVTLYWFVLAAVTVLNSPRYQTYQLPLLGSLFLVLGLIIVQIGLGISNVLLARPLLVSICHNLTAALLFTSAIRFAFYSYRCNINLEVKHD
jgi:cytochrome c oxidase assembly protein subunit 15